jgi:hypothetical protein
MTDDVAMWEVVEWLLVLAPIGILVLIPAVLIALRIAKKSRGTKVAFGLLLICVGAWFSALTINGLYDGRLGAGRYGGWVTPTDGAKWWISVVVHVLGPCAFGGLGLWLLAKGLLPSNNTVEADARRNGARGSP